MGEQKEKAVLHWDESELSDLLDQVFFFPVQSFISCSLTCCFAASNRNQSSPVQYFFRVGGQVPVRAAAPAQRYGLPTAVIELHLSKDDKDALWAREEKLQSIINQNLGDRVI